MFAIIISEKGGGERRESFDKSEINVGRVQGNDLMLPKGNVSKHHARLLFRDGRFIVTDLKSTNGTYVNGRKIAQATIVREGDKIYIGDFVLRLETAQAQSAADEADDDEVEETANREQPKGPPVTAAAPSVPMKPEPRPAPSAAPRPSGAASPPFQQTGRDMSPPAFPSSEDVEESAPVIPKPRVSPSVAPPPVGSRPMTMPLTPMGPPALGRASVSAAPPPLPGASAPSAAAIPAPAASPASVAPPPPKPSAPPRAAPKDSQAQAGRRLALIALVDRLGERVDLSALDARPEVPAALASQIEKALREESAAMKADGDVSPDVDLEGVVRDAQRELLGLGAFGPLLDDEEVTEIHASRFDHVLTVRGGNLVSEPFAFSSEVALARAASRLVAESGEARDAGEHVVERRLPRAAIVAVFPPAAASPLVTLRKRRKIEASLEDLVRGGTLSRAMAQVLDAAVQGRANVLVTGEGSLGVIAALAASIPSGERVALVHDIEEIAASQAHMVPIAQVDAGARGERALRAAAKLRSDRLVVTHVAGSLGGVLVDVMSGSEAAVIAGLRATSLRQALGRLVTQVVVASKLDPAAAREVVADAFDLALEVTTTNGQVRVTRLAELGGTDAKGIVARDVFTWTDGAPDGGYTPTGVVPRLAPELASRGFKLDGALFKRAR